MAIGIRNWLASLTVVALSALGATPTVAEVSPEAAYEMMIISGTAGRILKRADEIDVIAMDKLRDTLKRLPDEFSQKYMEKLRTFFDGDVLISLNIRLLSAVFSQEEVDAFNAFYRTPTGRRIAKIEVAAAGAGILDRISEQYDGLEARLDRNPVRRGLLERLDEALHFSDGEASLGAAVFVGAMRSLKVEIQEAPVSSFDPDFELIRKGLTTEMRQYALVRFIYTYGPLTDAELEEYLVFLNTEVGMRFHISLNSAKTVFLKDKAKALADEIGAFLSEN